MKNKKSSYNMVKYEEKGSVPEQSDFLHNFTPKNPVLQKYSSRGKCLNFLNGGNFDKTQVGKESKPNEQPLNEKSKKEALRNHDMEMNS